VFGRFPCIFPGHQGFIWRDEFATDCVHRHFVSGMQRLPACIEDWPEKIPRFRGPWPFRPGASEPETAGSGAKVSCSSRLSLLPSWAVRFRSRIASAEAVARLTGNIMIAVRLPEVADED
jgi:hypothetical protein